MSEVVYEPRDVRRARYAVARTGCPESAEMSRPGWKSGPPWKGSVLEPKVEDSQPATGQIDGVAAASASLRSTPARALSSWRSTR